MSDEEHCDECYQPEPEYIRSDDERKLCTDCHSELPNDEKSDWRRN